ncbi:MAG: hypothetical protein ACSHXJ_02620 [Marinomonas colpomeniae]
MSKKLIIDLLTPKKHRGSIISVEQNIVNFFAHSDIKIFRKNIEIILKNKKLSKLLRPTNFHSLTETNKITRFGTAINKERTLIYLVNLLKENNNKIKTHLQISKTIDSKVLFGKFSEAEELLDEYNIKLGENFWSIRTRMTILSERKSFENLRDFYSEKNNSIDNLIFLHLIQKCFWLQQAKDTQITLEKAILSDIKDFTGEIKAFGDLISLIFIPPEIKSITTIDSIYFIEEFPIIDIYELLSFYIFHLKEQEIHQNNFHEAINQFNNLELNCNNIELKSNEITLSGIPSFLLEENSSTHPEILILEIAKKASINNLEFITNNAPFFKILNHSIRIIKQETSLTQEIRELEGIILKLYKSPHSYLILNLISDILPYHFENKSIIEKKALSTYRIKKTDTAKETLIPKDLIESEIDNLISKNKYIEAINFCTEKLIKNESYHISLPLKKLCKKVEFINIISIDSMILLSFSSRFISAEYDQLLSDIFEDYLEEIGIESPIELLNDEYELNEKNIYFLEHICTPNHLDCLPKFNNSEELYLERIIILFYLEQKTKSKKYLNECEKIIKKMVAEKNTSKIERNKISINKSSIKDKKLGVINSLLEIYSSSKNEDSNNKKYIHIKNETMEKNETENIADNPSNETVLLTGNKDSTLLKIISQTLDSYLFDEDDGLDNCLSAEIRHGFFGNKMRSRAENLNLLVETDTDETHWTNHYNHLNQAFSELANALLKDFSLHFNKLISELEERLKISQESNKPSRFFDYTFTIYDIDDIRDSIKPETSPSELFEEIIKVIDSKTTKNLEKTREYINTKFRDDIYLKIEQLEEELNNADTNHFNDIKSNIRTLKHGIGEDINEISSWFHLTDKEELEDLSINQLLHTADEYFTKTRRTHNKNIINVNSSRQISGDESKGLVFVLINLMNNSRDHGCKENEIIIKAYDSKMHTYILIKNLTDNEVDVEKLEIIKSNILNIDKTDFKNKEGGTGLLRSYWTLKSLNEKYSLNVYTEKKSFAVEIDLGKEKNPDS